MRARLITLVSVSLLLVLVMSVLPACAPAEPQVVKETVKETVVVEKEVVVEKVITATPKPKEKTQIIVAQNADINILDPHKMQATVDMAIWLSVFNGLTVFDPTMTNPQPGMAESWETPDDTTFIFHLRKDAKWHSGRPFTADDVVFNFDRIIEIAGAGRLAGYMSDVESVEKIDDNTVQFNLKGPSAVFLMYTPYFVFVDPETIGQIETQPIGSGPYVFTEWIPNDRVTLTRYADYFDQETPRPDELIITPIKEEQSRLAALQTGEVHVASNISPKLLTELAGMPGITAYRPEVSAAYRVINMHVTEPPFDNKKVRQAVAAAIDREAIWRSVWFSSGEPSCNPIPNTNWAYDPAQECGPRDVEKAKQLIAESGVATPIKVTLKVWSDDFEPKTAAIIKSNLEEIGFEVDIKVDDFAFWLDDVWVNKNYQICTTGYTREADPDGLMSSVYRKGQGNNVMEYDNPEVDALFDKAKSVYDLDERAKYYQQIVDIVLDDAPLVKTITHYPYWAAQDSVGGVALLPKGTLAFNYLHVK
jgi:peptide/nickel transport system substrate-binding protein